MTTFAATEAKNNFGELLDAAHREPVEISKKGRAVAVLLSVEDYEEMKARLRGAEKPTDFSWLREWRKKALKGRKGGALSKADYYEHLGRKHG